MDNELSTNPGSVLGLYDLRRSSCPALSSLLLPLLAGFKRAQVGSSVHGFYWADLLFACLLLFQPKTCTCGQSLTHSLDGIEENTILLLTLKPEIRGSQ